MKWNEMKNWQEKANPNQPCTPNKQSYVYSVHFADERSSQSTPYPFHSTLLHLGLTQNKKWNRLLLLVINQNIKILCWKQIIQLHKFWRCCLCDLKKLSRKGRLKDTSIVVSSRLHCVFNTFDSVDIYLFIYLFIYLIYRPLSKFRWQSCIFN